MNSTGKVYDDEDDDTEDEEEEDEGDDEDDDEEEEDEVGNDDDRLLKDSDQKTVVGILARLVVFILILFNFLNEIYFVMLINF